MRRSDKALTLVGNTIVNADGGVLAILPIQQARALRQIYTLPSRAQSGAFNLSHDERRQIRADFEALWQTSETSDDRVQRIVAFALEQAKRLGADRATVDQDVPLPPIPLAEILQIEAE